MKIRYRKRIKRDPKNGPGTVYYRFNQLLNNLRLRCSNLDPSLMFSARPPELYIVEYLDNEKAQLKNALKVAQVAIDDWINVYASEHCSEKRVEEAQTRLNENGTIAYLATVAETIRQALKD